MTDSILYATDTIPILSFTLGGQNYALLVEDVMEVAAMAELTPLYDALPGVLGIVNRHGESLPIFDLSVLMGYEPVPIEISTLFIVIQYEVAGEERCAGLVVEQVEQVEYILRKNLQKSTASGKRIHGIINNDERMMQVIAPALVLPSDVVS